MSKTASYTRFNDAERYNHWHNVQDSCQLCEMSKETDWYIETRDWLVANTFAGTPMIVSKTHQRSLTEEQRASAEHVAGLVFDEYGLHVSMKDVEDHWHAHIITDTEARIKRY